ncbi:MAG: hypothetical protein Q7U10_06350 [Thermodesulfovibrionia bacterium]|nr:hypothetical protein [Thermodesulfovibrionia bacterium]
MIEMKDLVPIVISIVALLGSIISLYVSKFRMGELHLTAGEHTAISHDLEGPVSFILAVNFANAGSKHLTVDRVALLIQHSGSPEGYLLEPAYYLAFGESGELIRDSLAVPITVFGGENVTKQVQFSSSIERPFEYQMTKDGTYDLTLLAWLHGSTKPSMSDCFSLVVEEAHVAKLLSYIKEKKNLTVMLKQSKWRNWDAHSCKANEVEGIIEHATSLPYLVNKKRK